MSYLSRRMREIKEEEENRANPVYDFTTTWRWPQWASREAMRRNVVPLDGWPWGRGA